MESKSGENFLSLQCKDKGERGGLRTFLLSAKGSWFECLNPETVSTQAEPKTHNPIHKTLEKEMKRRVHSPNYSHIHTLADVDISKNPNVLFFQGVSLIH